MRYLILLAVLSLVVACAPEEGPQDLPPPPPAFPAETISVDEVDDEVAVDEVDDADESVEETDTAEETYTDLQDPEDTFAALDEAVEHVS